MFSLSHTLFHPLLNLILTLLVYGELPKKEALAPNSRGSNGARSSFASGKDQSTRRGRKDLIGASREIHKRNRNVGMEGTGGKKRKRSQAESEVDEKGEVGFELNSSSRLPKPSGSGGKVGETAPIQKQRKDWGMLYQIYLQDMTVEDALSLLKIVGLVKCKSELELKKLVPKLVSTGQVVAVHSDCYFRVEKVDIHLADSAVKRCSGIVDKQGRPQVHLTSLGRSQLSQDGRSKP